MLTARSSRRPEPAERPGSGGCRRHRGFRRPRLSGNVSRTWSHVFASEYASEHRLRRAVDVGVRVLVCCCCLRFKGGAATSSRCSRVESRDALESDEHVAATRAPDRARPALPKELPSSAVGVCSVCPRRVFRRRSDGCAQMNFVYDGNRVAG